MSIGDNHPQPNREAPSHDAVAAAPIPPSFPQPGAHPPGNEIARLLLENSADAVIGIDALGQVQWLNSAAQTLMGGGDPHALKRPLREICAFEDRVRQRKVPCPGAAALASRQPQKLPEGTIVLFQDGLHYPVEGSATPLRDEAGHPLGAVLILRDITRRLQEEAALEDRRSLMAVRTEVGRALASSAPVQAVLEKCCDALVRHLNIALVGIWMAREATGALELQSSGAGGAFLAQQDETELMGQGHLHRIAQSLQIHVSQTVADDASFTQQMDVFRQAGVVAFAGFPLLVEGRCAGVAALLARKTLSENALAEIAIFADRMIQFIDRRRSEERFRAQAELNRVTLACIGDAVISADTTGHVTYLNPVAEELTGWRLDEARGVALGTVFRIVNETSRKEVENPALRALKEGKIVGLANHTVLIAKNGSERPIDDSAAPIRDESGTIIGAVLVFRDISERKRTDRELRTSEVRRRLALDAAELGSWNIDPAKNSLLSDERFRMILHGSTDPLSYEEAFAAIHLGDRERVRAAVEAATRPVEPAAYSEEYRVIHPDGSVHWVFGKGRATFAGDAPARQVLSLDGTIADITAQKRIDEEAHDYKVRLEATLAAGEVATWTWNIQQDRVIADRNLAKLFGVSEADAAGGPIAAYFQAIHPDDIKRVQTRIGKALQERAPFEETYRIRGVTGDSRTVIARGKAEYDVHGQAIMLPGAVLDITRQIQAEEKLRESEEQLRFALKAARTGTWELDAGNDRFSCCDACKQNFGRGGSDSFTYQELIASIHPEDRQRFLQTMDHAMAQAGEFDVEYRAHWPDESEHWVQMRGNGTAHANGRTTTLSGTSQDISQRKRTEQSVRFLADASVSLAGLVDPESTLERIAQLAVRKFADWCVVELLDDSASRRRLVVTAPAMAATVQGQDASDALRTEQEAGAWMLPFSHEEKAGEATAVFDLDAPRREEDSRSSKPLDRLRAKGIKSYLAVPLVVRNKVIGSLSFFSASSHLRFANEELHIGQELGRRVATAMENALLYRALQEQDRRKDEFLATLAHELRNPLAPVRNGIQILHAIGQVNAQASQTLEMMGRQLEHMVHMIDDLMDVARVSSGKVVLRKERMDLNSAVTSAVETSRRLIDAGGHTLAVEMFPNQLILDADRTRLTQVFSNLINNAAKYTPHGGRISFIAERDASEAVIRVKDNGIGIPAEMLPVIFEMFTQIGSSLDRAQGGLGIGLTLVKRLVEMHGGTVVARSAGSGKGSEFTVRLPLAADILAPEKPGQQSRCDTLEGHYLVLVVDDNRDAAHSLSMLLELKGHKVKAAFDGLEAMRALETFRPDLIVLDIGLPGMSGYEVARQIREKRELRGVVLAALTGWGQEEDRRQTREAGFDYHLVKPADPAEIEKILSRCRQG